jgi:catechol 2,3-dioxygenase-like lactoylglutathione lyase family enzyme
MKRLHVHLSVKDLDESVRFYRGLFAAEPTILKPDYAKWMLEDPRVNFAISTRSEETGLNHLGIQVESDAELAEIEQRAVEAGLVTVPEQGAACCYAQSDKQWLADPQGVVWEAFHTVGEIPTYGGQRNATDACCAPAIKPKVKLGDIAVRSSQGKCC